MTTAFTPAEAARLATIEAAPDAPESHAATIERMAQAMYVYYGENELSPWEDAGDGLRGDMRAAAAAAYRAEHEDGALLPAVLRRVAPCKVGDPDPTPHGHVNSVSGACDAVGGEPPHYVCTLDRGHGVRWHIAGDGDEVCAVWSFEAAGDGDLATAAYRAEHEGGAA